MIFESGEEHGLYRYLLTMLDGLESNSAARVCVMMTAMDVGNLPPALVRSGRIELWLETRLPDEAARTAILNDLLATAPELLRGAGVSQVVDETADFSGADLKRVVEDAKTLYAYDRATGQPERGITDYFLLAVNDVRTNKQRYEEAQAQANAHRTQRPAWFSPYFSSRRR